jgi:hypothetical protein
MKNIEFEVSFRRIVFVFMSMVVVVISICFVSFVDAKKEGDF